MSKRLLIFSAVVVASLMATVIAQDYGKKQTMKTQETAPAQPAAKVEKTDAEWRAELTPEQYRVLRQAGTERPFVGEYTDTKTEGIYQCRACGAELFRSTEKFESHCGWPSFFDPARSDAVILQSDGTLGMHRVEVLCATCHSHLGHVFAGEGYPTPTDQRYCINSISLKLIPA
jgi:peptide-methionine (R)-S-oxide reductase